MLHPIKDITAIPPSSVVRSRFQALAMLDAVLMPDWESRYFSFNSKWGNNEMMASMRNGEGDEYFFLFSKEGVAGKIFCHDIGEIETAKAILARVPNKFSSFLTEAAFRLQEITYCLWQTSGDSKWEISPPVQGEIPLLAFIQSNGEYYREWAEGYYEKETPSHFIEAIFAHQPLTDKLLSILPQKRVIGDLIADASEIGYPFKTD